LVTKGYDQTPTPNIIRGAHRRVTIILAEFAEKLVNGFCHALRRPRPAEFYPFGLTVAKQYRIEPVRELLNQGGSRRALLGKDPSAKIAGKETFSDVR
jgi:hypothetical protein